MTAIPDCWAVVPAAGVGRRMGGDTPKQYLQLMGRPVIEHALNRLLAHSAINGVCVAVSVEDEQWRRLSVSDDHRIITVSGGRERCHSVLNGLIHLHEIAHDDDWVLVHDAARPCVRLSDIDRLIHSVMKSNVGGILAVPLHDTVKRSGDDQCRIDGTVPRERLWHAFTPQMFRLGELRQALESAIHQHRHVTDEAGAMEWAGFHPQLVTGAEDNIKITRPEDLPLAEFFLQRQARE